MWSNSSSQGCNIGILVDVFLPKFLLVGLKTGEDVMEPWRILLSKIFLLILPNNPLCVLLVGAWICIVCKNDQ